MALLVNTQEVEAEFVGFDAYVSHIGSFEGMDDEGFHSSRRVVIDAPEREDGAVGQRLVLHMETDRLREVCQHILDHLKEGDL